MKYDLLNQEVLAVYDVRGIQSYIFKTNAVKEIIGASNLVEGLITKGLEQYIAQEGLPKAQYLTDWRKEEPEIAYLTDDSVQMEVMFIGGGNAYVLFRKGSVCQKVNRFLAKYVLEQTYSLNLAVAVVRKSGSYKEDYRKINERLRKVKAEMPDTQPIGALPFMDADSVTGYPITDYDREKKTYICHEAALKRAQFKETEKDRKGKDVKVSEKVFDDMVTEKGDNSSLALCHIDGNSMGIRIKKTMENVEEYQEAIPKMRQLSKEIARVFENAFYDMCDYIDSISDKVRRDWNLENGKHLYRKIILAGDDITFVCNAKTAIPAVQHFLSGLGDYSACGGIAFFNSHFPFSDAYEVAEACCDSAKKRAKEDGHRKSDGSIGCYMDYQICTNIRAAELDSYRERHYVNQDGCFIARPYYVPGTLDSQDPDFVKNNKEYSVEKLIRWLDYFTGGELARNKTKELRNVIPLGQGEIKRELSFLKSRGDAALGAALAENPDEYKVLYDALEIMDLHVKDRKEEKEAAHENNN